ncbi:MAG: hypothetical protein R2771_15825 [Saprospiraceae bacterium]
MSIGRSPFCPGEEVSIHLDFFYNAEGSQVDWFLGFVPDFGPGWDVLDFDWGAYLPTGSGPYGGQGELHEEGTACEATLHRTFPHLCTYRDEDGILHILHTECDDDLTLCTETGMGDGDVLPNGYFWISDGSNSTCINGSCDPRNHWGIGSKTSSVSWDFTIKVKDFEDENECNQYNDLRVSFLCFSDDGAGCWEDASPCRLDKKQFGPDWEVECTFPPGIEADEQAICTDGQLNLYVETDDGSPESIEITYEDNPNVDGEMEHTFIGGGYIDDILSINDPDICDAQTVTYYAQVIIPGFICTGKIDTIEAFVYPLPRLIEQEVYGSCFGDLPYELGFDAECGYPGNLQYQWEDDLSSHTGTGNSIVIDQSYGVGLHTFSITVTDELGCSNTGEVQFNIYDDVRFRLQGDTLC